jgi:hypothetical protein
VYELPVVETTGYNTLSLRDREKANLGIKGNNKIKYPWNPVILSIKS